MNKNQIEPWIFLATALASQSGPANVREISEVADGINHSVPTNQEVSSSLKRLLVLGLISKNGGGYELTSVGKQQYELSKSKYGSMLEIWKDLEDKLKSMLNNI